MKEDCINIYKKARKNTDLTQKEAAEKLYVSERSLIDYETGKTVPSCETVCNMVEVYGTKWLAYKHLRISTKVGSMFLPALELAEQSKSVLRLQKEVADVVNVKPRMVELAVSDTDKDEDWEDVNREIQEMIQAGLGVLFYQR